jgi:hypothetical protein
LIIGDGPNAGEIMVAAKARALRVPDQGQKDFALHCADTLPIQFPTAVAGIGGKGAV